MLLGRKIFFAWVLFVFCVSVGLPVCLFLSTGTLLDHWRAPVRWMQGPRSTMLRLMVAIYGGPSIYQTFCRVGFKLTVIFPTVLRVDYQSNGTEEQTEPETSSDLPKVTQVISDKAGTRQQVGLGCGHVLRHSGPWKALPSLSQASVSCP